MMRKTLTLLGAALLLLPLGNGLLPALGHARQVVPPRPAPATDDGDSGILVQGTGEVRAAPDIARLSLGVQTQAKDAAEAARDNAARTTRVIEAVRRAGVAERDVQTANYSIFPQYDSRPRPVPPGGQPGSAGYEQVLTGYQVSNTVNVTVRQIANASAVLDAAVRAGANVAQGISFELDTPRQTQAREDALRRAVADARRKAQVIAEAAGVGPITLVAISENGAPPIRPVFREAFAVRAQANADVATPVQPGENTVTATVTIRYRFAPTSAPASSPAR